MNLKVNAKIRLHNLRWATFVQQRLDSFEANISHAARNTSSLHHPKVNGPHTASHHQKVNGPHKANRVFLFVPSNSASLGFTDFPQVGMLLGIQPRVKSCRTPVILHGVVSLECRVCGQNQLRQGLLPPPSKKNISSRNTHNS